MWNPFNNIPMPNTQNQINMNLNEEQIKEIIKPYQEKIKKLEKELEEKEEEISKLKAQLMLNNQFNMNNQQLMNNNLNQMNNGFQPMNIMNNRLNQINNEFPKIKMEGIISGDFKCPKCGNKNGLSSISDSTYFSTWILWQKRGNKWIIGCYGDGGINYVWWWNVFKYIPPENGEGRPKKCWDSFGGATEKDWIKGHYKWKCLECGHYSKTFTEFIENLDELNKGKEDEEEENY